MSASSETDVCARRASCSCRLVATSALTHLSVSLKQRLKLATRSRRHFAATSSWITSNGIVIIGIIIISIIIVVIIIIVIIITINTNENI